MNVEFLAVLDHWEKEKGIKRDVMIAAVNEALVMAAKKSCRSGARVALRD